MWVKRLLGTSSFRIAALCALLFWAILAGLLLMNYAATSHALENQLQARVQEDFDAFAEEADAEGADAVVKEIDERAQRPVQLGTYYFLAGPDGAKLSGNLSTVATQPGWQHIPVPTAGHHDHEKPHEVWGHGNALPGGYFLFVGQDAWHVLDARRSLVTTFLWSGLLGGALALLVGAFLSRSMLSRIDAINETSNAIMKGNLQRRIPVRGNSNELDQLSQNLNQLFDSNQSLLESLKDVSANIAHDLRTPLTRLRNRLEVVRKGGALPKTQRTALLAATAESDQLLASFSALLRIAQIESGTRKQAFAPVDLSALAEKVVGLYQAVAEDEGKLLESAIAPQITCKGDEELLFQLCVNLVENAIRHTPAGARITLSVSAPATLTLADNGPGIPADMREKVLQRFYRLERARTTPGNGLGLSLVAAIAGLHGSKIELEDNHPGLKASVRLQPT